MNEKQKKIIMCAIEVITRYGVRKATMGDIADQAGISRQTLYASYKNKEEILAATIRYSTDKTIEEVEKAWSVQVKLSEKIDVFFEMAIIFYFKAMADMPDWKDIISGHNNIGPEEKRAAEDRKADLLTSLFVEYDEPLKKNGSNAKDYAEFFASSASNFKYIAQDEAQLRRLLSSLKSSTLLMVSEH